MVQNLVRNNKLKKWFRSPTQDFQQLILGQTLWSGCLTLIEDVVDANSSGLYLLGTKEELLERLYACNEFTAADNFIEASSSLSLRSASKTTSGRKQGFVSCHCKRYCIDKKCKCCSKNMKCNSVILTAPAKINELRHFFH